MIPKKTRVKRLLIHTLIKILIFSVVLGAIGFILNFPGIANDLAMGQLENDYFSYAFWQSYINVRNIFNSVYDVIICFFVGTLIHDIHTFIKINKGEN